eukprot:SAG31_NODE_143_length_22627_cov_14.541347_13_plen_312_part_00
MDTLWAENAENDPDQHFQFFASDLGVLRQYPGDAIEPPSYDGPTPNSRCTDPPTASATAALLDVLGVEDGFSVDALTAADCLAAGYSCQSCDLLGFVTACACPTGSLSFEGEEAVDDLVTAARLCTWYDPRIKPWYVQATTGPKDVVVVLDTSGSMDSPLNALNENPLSIAKKAASAVFDTLTAADRIGVVAFSDSATSHENELVYATEAAKVDLRTWVNEQLSSGGSTNYEAAFMKTFELFDVSTDSCLSEDTDLPQDRMSVVLFMTDGKDTSSMPIDRVEELNRREHSKFLLSLLNLAGPSVRQSQSIG